MKLPWNLGSKHPVLLVAGLGGLCTVVNLSPAQDGTPVTGGIGGGQTISGTVVAWGSNYLDQTNVPPGLTNVIAIAAGDRESLALKADGTVVGWGGKYGNGQVTPPEGLTNVISIAIGASNALALKSDSSVVVWGTNNFGQVFVPDGLTNMVAIAGGFLDSLVLRKDGVLLAWGRQPALAALQSNVVAVSEIGLSASAFHYLIVTPEGKVLASGDNSLGQCDVPSDLTKVVAVAAGYSYSLAVKEDGTLVSWGKVWDGSDYVPLTLPAEATDVVAISTRGDICMALRADGTVVAWGTYWDGPGSVVPIYVPAGLTNVIAISAGADHCLALVGERPPLRRALATALHHTGDKFTLSLPTQSGRVYRLEQTDSLDATNWAPVQIAPGNGALQMLTDPVATNSLRLYRIRQW